MGKLVILLIWYRWFKKKDNNDNNDNNDTIGKITYSDNSFSYVIQVLFLRLGIL